MTTPEEDDPFHAYAVHAVERAVTKRVLNWQPWALGLLVLVAVGVYGARQFKDRSESISRIRNHPANFDGQAVLLRGQVGDVFDMGASTAFHLIQNRDTIVVFTRGARPMAHQKITVRGSISMGYLDGVARPALFESASSR